jgi:peptide/nickel transport system substrate-binding protein
MEESTSPDERSTAGYSHQLSEVPLSRRAFVTRSALLGGTALLAPSVLAACSSSTSATTPSPSGGAKPRRGGHLRTGHVGGGNTETLNPLINHNPIDVARGQQLYEMLFFPRPDLVNEPRLAESVEPNADATVWRLTLRKGVTFHNGKPFVADDVLYSWTWALNPKNGASDLSYLKPFNMGNTRKISDHEIEIHLNTPVGDMTGLLATTSMSVIPDGMTDFNKPNGTGPFKFVSWTRGTQSLFTRNDSYWQAPKPYVDDVTMHSIPDQNARLDALLGGQIDAMEAMNYAQAKAQRSSTQIKLLKVVSPSAIPFTMRTDIPPFTDNNVRLAFKYAVNREEMISAALLGYGSIGNDLFGKGFPSYNSELPPRPYDPQRAKSLLKKAGISTPFNVKLYTSNGVIPGLYEAAIAFVQQAKPAGINVTLQGLPPSSYFSPGINKYLSASAPFYQSYWPYSFEQQAVNALVPQSAFEGETAWAKVNPQWGAEFVKAEGIADAPKRDAAYKALQVPLYEEGGYVVWGYSDIIDAYTPRLNGVVGNPLFSLGYFEFLDWWFTP